MITLYRKYYIVILTTLLSTILGFSQNNVTITPTKILNFGRFYTGQGGGTVTVTHNGMRTSTGNIFLVNSHSDISEAKFEVKICPGKSITITHPINTTLYGNNGGSITLTLGPSDRGVSGTTFFVGTNCTQIHPISLGGILNIPSNVIPGIYTGFYEITFNQQ